jgi:hypothetical protein
MPDYILVKVLSDGLVGLSSEEFGRQLWDRCRTRKTHECQVCHEWSGVGSQMYRPITNGYNRTHRICEDCVDGPVMPMSDR